MRRNPTTRHAGQVAAVCLLLAALGAAPARAEGPPRKVFAVYMVCFLNSVEFYSQEIELAQRHGLDGFLLDFGAWGRHDAKTGAIGPSGYTVGVERIFQAARELGSGFQLVPMPEYSVQPAEIMVADMVGRYRDHPNLFRIDGKCLLVPYGGSMPAYEAAIKRLEQKGERVLLVPFISNRRHPMSYTMESLLRLFQAHPRMDGWYFFAADNAIGNLMRINATARRATMFLDKLYIAGVVPAYNSANLRDYQGMAGYGAMWEGVIRDGADLVAVTTWNDYNEDSALMPYRWKDGWDKAYYDRDESFLDVTGYYAAWYHTGRPPAITQDKVYFAHRARSRWQAKAWDFRAGRWVDITAVPHPFDQIHDDVQDRLYATTFLTAPAELVLRIGEAEQTFAQPAGVAHVAVALRPGVAHVALRRDGRTLVEADGRKQVIAAETKDNSPRGYHLLNRTWTGAAVVGPATRIEAESGRTSERAEIVQVGGRACVRNVEADGSGFAVPVHGLKTATYNVRVVYANPTDREARLTLTADGPPRGERDYPYYVPLFLPPTPPGRLATVSFLWSLYDKTSRLGVQWQANPKGEMANRIGTPYADVGVASIDAIELVRVEPVRPAPRRDDPAGELVPIPGGSFTMGDAAGDADERPAHEVTLAPFAIGRREVTNAEFERFDPNHRQYRDGYSWRDGEPVIYVSWVDAARYCNWLSQQAGLTPAYELAEIAEAAPGAGGKTRKEWVLRAEADGFRLPTEAQWEYVAGGRGEGRRYPWGGAEPQPGRHGRFVLKRALDPDCRLPAAPEGGVTVVGSYPQGASRDGVMDLAGNVAEWCSDWFAPYSADRQADPLGRVPGNYRSIRGGSWGWYGWDQRNANREFNNPNYGGYIYIGFRMALPEAGWKKLSK